MAKLWQNIKKKKESEHGNRFYTQLDMAEIKHQEANKASQIKRGELVPKGENHYISVCGCGVEGCFMHGDYASISKEEMDAWQKRKHPHHKKK